MVTAVTKDFTGSFTSLASSLGEASSFPTPSPMKEVEPEPSASHVGVQISGGGRDSFDKTNRSLDKRGWGVGELAKPAPQTKIPIPVTALCLPPRQMQE